MFANDLSPFGRQAAKCVPYRQVFEVGMGRDVCRNFRVRVGCALTGFSHGLSSFLCNYQGGFLRPGGELLMLLRCIGHRYC